MNVRMYMYKNYRRGPLPGLLDRRNRHWAPTEPEKVERGAELGHRILPVRTLRLMARSFNGRALLLRFEQFYAMLARVIATIAARAVRGSISRNCLEKTRGRGTRYRPRRRMANDNSLLWRKEKKEGNLCVRCKLKNFVRGRKVEVISFRVIGSFGRWKAAAGKREKERWRILTIPKIERVNCNTNFGTMRCLYLVVFLAFLTIIVSWYEYRPIYKKNFLMKRLIIETCITVSRNVDFLLLFLLRYLILSNELFSNSHFLIISIFTRNTHFERHILFKRLPAARFFI